MYDEEIEKAILFYVIFQEEQFELTEEDFINATHKQIIKAINELKAKRQDISILTINNKIQGKNIIEYIGILGDYVSITSADTAYKILKECTKKRQVFNLAKKIVTEIGSVENADIYIEKTIKDFQNIEFQTEKETDFRKQVIKTVQAIEENINKKEDRSLYTGYFDLDNLTDGFHNGELTVIGARPRNSEKQHLHYNLQKILQIKEKM